MGDESSSTPAGDGDAAMKHYKLYLGDLQKIGDRHEHTRKYYLSLITALFTVLSLGGSGVVFSLKDGFIWPVALFGAALCELWAQHMSSYSALFHAKFALLKKMEEKFPCQPFTDEGKLLSQPPRYISMTTLDKRVARVFLVLFLVLPLLKLASH